MRHPGKLLCILFLFGLSACATLLGPEPSEPESPALAPPPPYYLYIEGEPGPVFVTTRGGLFIWKVGERWHVRVARTDIPNPAYPRDIFIGNILVENGVLLVTEKQVLRPPDELRFMRNSLFFRLEVEGRQEIKEVRFTVQPVVREYCVSFDLTVNGLANPELVHLGRSLFRPAILPLRVCVRD